MADTTSPQPGTESSARGQTPDRGSVADWFAHTHPVPRQAHSEWANCGVAMLPLGVRFDAIRVPATRVHAAIGSTAPGIVDPALADWLTGPVIRNTRTGGGCYYVLIPPDATWTGPHDRLGDGAYLGVPRPGLRLSPVTHWSVQPQRTGRLCDPEHLAALLSTAETLAAES